MSTRPAKNPAAGQAAAAPLSQARTPLSRQKVVDAAITLADTAGMDALSMRQLAQRLGVEAMSLYNHVPNKDALIDAMVDEVAGRIALPRPGRPWRAEMARRAHSARALLLQHPWAALPMVSRLNVGPGMLRYADATHGCLLAAGFGHAAADHARHALDSHIHGFTLQELHFPLDRSDYASAAAAFLPMLPPGRYPHMHALAAEVIAGRYNGVNDFDFGLQLLLDGLERLLTR
jgi:AcrR family transcriptional regulator